MSNSWSGNEGNTNLRRRLPRRRRGDHGSDRRHGYNARAQWPAILPSVIGVGGTSLKSTSPRARRRGPARGAAAARSTASRASRLALIRGVRSSGGRRSAVADPETGVAVFDSFHHSGWLVFGGTSVATPIVASVFALAGNTGTNDPGNLYSHASAMNDVTSGRNGGCGAPLCMAGVGWDGPTGLGTPMASPRSNRSYASSLKFGGHFRSIGAAKAGASVPPWRGRESAVVAFRNVVARV